MASVNTYLNFPGTQKMHLTSIGQFSGVNSLEVFHVQGNSTSEKTPPLPEEDKDLVMHIALPILNGHVLMGTDAPESMDLKLPLETMFTSVSIPIQGKKTRRLFKSTFKWRESGNGITGYVLGDYYGSCSDKYGVQWMFNCAEKSK